VDIVLVTRLETGTPAVLLSLRNPTVCFGGKWWIYGGALQAYMSIEEFIAGRATKECGVPVRPEALIGVYRTIAEDYIGSTLQPCYAARVPIEVIRAKMSTDEDHSNVRLFTISDLILLEGNRAPEYHWYPVRVALLALRSMPK
jgi:ADP-ribose pyrophosphatase YjhB (NUDIX family)